MKTIVTLDPEYLPWEDTENLVPLIRRGGGMMSMLALLALLGGGLYYGLPMLQGSMLLGGGDLDVSPAEEAPAPAEAPAEAGDAIEATATPALDFIDYEFSGRTGAVGVRYSSSVTYLPCETWGRAEDQALPTDEGPLIDYEEGLVIWCDGNRIEVPYE